MELKIKFFFQIEKLLALTCKRCEPNSRMLDSYGFGGGGLVPQQSPKPIEVIKKVKVKMQKKDEFYFHFLSKVSENINNN